MEARWIRVALLAATAASLGASYRTTNFVVTAESPKLAKEIGEAAEAYRRDLAIEWLGEELPRWSDICPITAHVSPQLGAGGMTQFSFNAGQPFAWEMVIQGSRERVLDSVLPHEITHTIFATHFGRPLPRWADEGACTTVEHPLEKRKQQQLLLQFLTSQPTRGIAFNRMFAMKEYPRDILPLYAQGHSVARYLIAQGGKQKFVRYIGEGMQTNDWSSATEKHYGFADLSELQVTWLDWVRRGSPELPAASSVADAGQTPVQLASAEVPAREQPASPAASGQQPASTELVASANRPAGATGEKTGGSWYARQRDRSRHERSAVGSDQAQFASAATAGQASSVQRSVTRPQGMTQPQQVILEWTRPERAAAGDASTYAPGSISGRYRSARTAQR